MPSMPNVRDSSGTIGTTWRPICLSRTSVLRMRTNAIVVDTWRSPVPLSWASNASSAGTSSGSALRRRCGSGPPSAPRGAALRQRAAERLAALVQVVHLGAVVVGLVERALGDLLVGERELEAVAEREQRAARHLLLLVGDVLALAGLAHPVALDRLGEDHGGAPLSPARGGV